MAQQNQKQEKRHENNNRNDRYRGRRNNQGQRPDERRTNKVHARGEQLQLVFEPRYQGTGLVAILPDGTMVSPGSLRFTPQPGVEYLCSVTFKQTAHGRRGSALPSLVETLSPNEWMDEESYRKALVVELEFQKRRDGKSVAFHYGWVVLPEDHVKVEPGVKLRCQLRETGGSVIIARPLCRVVAAKDAPKQSSKATLADTGLAKLVSSNPELVQLKRARIRPGVTRPQSDKDLTITEESRSIWNLLSSPGRPVTKRTPPDSLRKAIAYRIEDTKPDRKLRAFGGPDKAPYVICLEVGHLHAAVCQAAKQALALQGMDDERTETPTTVPRPEAAGPTKASAAPRPSKVPRPSAPRPQPAAEKAPAKEEDTRTDTLENALEEWFAEKRPASGQDLEFYLMRGVALMGQAATAAESEALAQREAGNRKEAERETAKAKDLKRFKAETETELTKLQG